MKTALPDSQKISLATATAIVVANMVGTGVFTSLGFQVLGLPAGFPIAMLWLVGGLLSFCGAVCYAELAAMMPRSGGEYHLLTQAYHPLLGFLSGWISVTVGFSAPIAAAAIAFGAYLSQAVDQLNAVLLATLVVAGVTTVHLIGLKVAGRFQLVFTTGKVILILFLILAAFLLGKPSGVSFVPDESSLKLIRSKDFIRGLYWVMYAYSGWNAAAYVAGEMKNPGRNVPLALILGTGMVTLLYLGLNMGFLWSTPMDEIASLENPETVSYLAASQIFGPNGAVIIGLLICFGLISTISSMVWAGPRVTQVMGEDYRAFRFLSKKSASGVPRTAILVQSAIVLLLVWTVPFANIIYYVQALLILSSLLVALAVFYLRWKKPDAERIYRTWGYPVTPAVFSLMSIYMLVVFVQLQPTETLWGIGTLIVGLAVYLLSRSR